jgi:GNAT superfamily N-acetyltransferase
LKASIPTTRLRTADRGALVEHFLSLDLDDRRLRFGAALNDFAVRAYVERIDFVRDGVFAVHDDALAVVAVAHVAPGPRDAELGLSVLPGWRGAGHGDALVARAVTYLRNRGIPFVFVHCLAENGAMMHLARRNGMRIAYQGGEADGRLALRPATPNTLFAEWMEDQRGTTVKAIRQGARNALALMGR